MILSDLFNATDKILELYLSLPETPARSSSDDLRLARDLGRRQISLEMIEAAFLLASVRRLFRDPTLPPLTPIRSLRYFLPVIEEVSANPLSPDYLLYLRYKLDSYVSKNPGSK